MKIVVTNVSANLRDLVFAAYGDAWLTKIEKNRVKGGPASVGIVIKNGQTNAVYLTNALDDATVADGFPIAAGETFSCDSGDLTRVKLIASVASQDVFVDFF